MTKRYLSKKRTLALLLTSALALACSDREEGTGPNDGLRIGTPNGGSTIGNGGSASGGDGSFGAGAGMGTGSTGNQMGAGASTGSGGGSSSGTGGGAPIIPVGPSHVVIVAHQDDDLLFINPALKQAIDKGEPLTTVYLTSGNAGENFMPYASNRELGIRSAYAFMAGVSKDLWSCAEVDFAGKAATECVITEKKMRLVFLRLPDGGVEGLTSQSLRRLWLGQDNTSAAVDNSGLSFTRDEMIGTLVELLAQRAATEIYTTDFSFLFRKAKPFVDHSDHEYAAMFAAAASARHPLSHGLRSYRTYSTSKNTPNLTSVESTMVGQTFSHYAACDSKVDGCASAPGCGTSICSTTHPDYINWFSRQIFNTRKSPGRTAQIKGTQGQFVGYCVEASAQSVTTKQCATATQWTWQTNYSLTTPEGLCLTAPKTGATNNATVEACDESTHQKWFVMDNGHIVLGSSPQPGENGSYNLAQCLDAGTAPETQVVVMDCGVDTALLFSF